MIWFDIKKLEKDLVNGEVSDKEGYNYLLVSMIAMTIVSYIGNEEYGNKWLLFIEAAIEIFLTVALLKLTFDLNSNGDKKDYFKRFISLSFVSGVRLIVFALIVSIPIGIIMFFVNKNFKDDQDTQDIYNLFLTTFFGIAYYFIFTSSFRRVHPKNI